VIFTVRDRRGEDVFGATRPAIGEPSGWTATGRRDPDARCMSAFQPLQANV